MASRTTAVAAIGAFANEHVAAAVGRGPGRRGTYRDRPILIEIDTDINAVQVTIGPSALGLSPPPRQYGNTVTLSKLLNSHTESATIIALSPDLVGRTTRRARASSSFMPPFRRRHETPGGAARLTQTTRRHQ